MGNAKRKDKRVPAHLKRLGITESQWMYLAKGNLDFFERPGWPWRVRISACIMAQSEGYKRDLCVLQVRGEADGDEPKLLPLLPGGIRKILRRATVEAYRESGIEIDEAKRKELDIDKGNMLRCLRELEEDDGLIVRVRANCPIRRLIDSKVSFTEALSMGLITPLAELPKAERLKVTNRAVMYKFAKPKPATVKALSRQEGDHPHKADTPEETQRRTLQLVFSFVRRPDVAAELVKRDDVRAQLDMYHQDLKRAQDIEKGAKDRLRAYLLAATPAPVAAAPSEAAPAPATGNLFDDPAPAAAAPEGVKCDSLGAAKPLEGNEREPAKGVKYDSLGAPAANGTTAPAKGVKYDSLAAAADPPAAALPEGFHRAIVQAFRGAGIGAPTRRQTRPIFDGANGAAADFAAAITPELLRRRRVYSPGVLPALLEEFQTNATLETAAAIAAAAGHRVRDAETIEALRWLAENDEDPAYRQQAAAEIERRLNPTKEPAA